MFCKNCGKEIDPKADICLGCGVKVDKEGKPSDLWYIVSLFGIIGGIFGYLTLRNRDKIMANRLLGLGFVISVLLFIITIAVENWSYRL